MASLSYLAISAIAISFYLSEAINIRHVDADRLLWAPMTSLKLPFVTFINDFNRPTWATRHQMTKENGRLNLRLAKGVPFALVCGACFQHSIFKPNLTVAITDHNSVSVPKRRGDRSFQYSVGVNECLMTYLITEPIKKDGTITCTLNRGKQVINEVVTFRAVDVEIKESPEDYEVKATETPIQLTCPPSPDEKSPVRNNPTMNVWHEEHKPSSLEQQKAQVGSPIISTKSTISLDQPRYTTTIVCSVYNIFSPSTVQQRRYKIQGRSSTAKSEYHVSGDLLEYEDEADILPPKVNLSSSILAIVIIAGVVCFLLGAVGIYRFFAAARWH